MHMGKTISFVKGKGSISHNNRDFIAENVDRNRTAWNVEYIKQPIREAYDQLFGEAIAEYNAKQKRKDRQVTDYLKDIKNSGNGEKQFYEIVVQIGKKDDTGVLDVEGNLSVDAKAASEILDEYARSFQERNPNLYLFNAVLHMDEATPHLHLDYIPVAHGYKTKMHTRNSLTKDLELYENIEMLAPKIIADKRHIYKGVSPNVDFYSGFVYDMLGIPVELYTAMFAVARIVGWSAHRIEEMICTDKIIRPAYMSVMEEKRLS